MPRLTFNDLDKKKTRKLMRNQVYHIAKINKVFTYLSTNQKYVGSSSQLALRLRGYLNQTHKITGKLIPLIKEKGLSKIKLEYVYLVLKN